MWYNFPGVTRLNACKTAPIDVDIVTCSRQEKHGNEPLDRYFSGSISLLYILASLLRFALSFDCCPTNIHKPIYISRDNLKWLIAGCSFETGQWPLFNALMIIIEAFTFIRINVNADTRRTFCPRLFWARLNLHDVPVDP